jgi:hypothetical protein
MAGKKRKRPGGKRVVHRVDPQEKTSKKKETGKHPAEPETPPIRERTKEKDSGFGVLKTVAGVIVVLIVGSMVLFNQSGGKDATRGDKSSGELCEKTVECSKGWRCFSYKEEKKKCMQVCGSKKQCEPEYTCTSAAERRGRKRVGVRSVCVENAKL